MKTATAYFYSKSPYETRYRWHKMAIYSESVAVEVVNDTNVLRDLNATAICATNDETGEIIALVERG